MIKKARMFMTKWVSKAMVIFTKSDTTRIKISNKLSKLSQKDIDAMLVPISLKESILSFIGKPKNLRTMESSIFLKFIPFSNLFVQSNTVEFEKLMKELADWTKPKGTTIVGRENITRGSFIVKLFKDGEEHLEIITLDPKLLAIFSNDVVQEHLHALQISRELIDEQLTKDKHVIHHEINETYKEFKDTSKLKDDNAEDIIRASKDISLGILLIRSKIELVKDATTVANILINSGRDSVAYLGDKDEGESEQTWKIINERDYDEDGEDSLENFRNFWIRGYTTPKYIDKALDKIPIEEDGDEFYKEGEKENRYATLIDYYVNDRSMFGLNILLKRLKKEKNQDKYKDFITRIEYILKKQEK